MMELYYNLLKVDLQLHLFKKCFVYWAEMYHRTNGFEGFSENDDTIV